MIQDTVVIGGECSLETRIEGDCDLTSMVEGDPDVLVVEGGGQTYPHYSGDYTVTPSGSVQVLDTSDKVMDNDVTVQAVAQGSATTPATIITANPSISVSSGGLITATVSKTQQITPTVVEGYVSAGTAGNVGVSGSNTEQLSVQGAQTIHPASTDQSIASGKYLTGNQTFKAVTVSGLTADKVLQGNVVKIGDVDDDDRIANVVGTAQQGITPTGTKSITANGTGIDIASYQYADVAVPNSYSQSDEGKVVSSGALVSQTAHADITPTTTDQTIDTTTNNSIKVKGDADLVAGNIKKDVDIFGVTGSYEGGGGGYTLTEIATASKPDGTVDLTGIKTGRLGMAGRPITRAEGVLDSASNTANLFKGCNSLVTAFITVNNAPTSGEEGIFQDCSKLETGVFITDSSKTNNQQNMFSKCTKLKTADVTLQRLHNNCFYNCSTLDTIILRRSDAICAMNQSTLLNSTKFKNGGTGGTIYIPKVLYDHLGDNGSLDYKKATNWATYEGYGTITWQKIEGSYYETHYADGTVIA